MTPLSPLLLVAPFPSVISIFRPPPPSSHPHAMMPCVQHQLEDAKKEFSDLTAGAREAEKTLKSLARQKRALGLERLLPAPTLHDEAEQDAVAEKEEREVEDEEVDAMDVDEGAKQSEGEKEDKSEQTKAMEEWERKKKELVELRELTEEEIAQRDAHTLKAVRLSPFHCLVLSLSLTPPTSHTPCRR